VVEIDRGSGRHLFSVGACKRWPYPQLHSGALPCGWAQMDANREDQNRSTDADPAVTATEAADALAFLRRGSEAAAHSGRPLVS
jgi:hypothetical protein